MLFEEFKSDIPDTHSEDIPGQLSRVQTKQLLTEDQSKLLDFLPKLMIVIVVIAIFFFIWWFFSRNAGTDEDTVPKMKITKK